MVPGPKTLVRKMGCFSRAKRMIVVSDAGAPTSEQGTASCPAWRNTRPNGRDRARSVADGCMNGYTVTAPESVHCQGQHAKPGPAGLDGHQGAVRQFVANSFDGQQHEVTEDAGTQIGSPDLDNAWATCPG